MKLLASRKCELTVRRFHGGRLLRTTGRSGAFLLIILIHYQNTVTREIGRKKNQNFYFWSKGKYESAEWFDQSKFEMDLINITSSFSTHYKYFWSPFSALRWILCIILPWIGAKPKQKVVEDWGSPESINRSVTCCCEKQVPVRYLSGPDLVKRGSLCCFSLELVVQGKSCRMCITTTTSAIEVASPSMYDADTHKGSLTPLELRRWWCRLFVFAR